MLHQRSDLRLLLSLCGIFSVACFIVAGEDQVTAEERGIYQCGGVYQNDPCGTTIHNQELKNQGPESSRPADAAHARLDPQFERTRADRPAPRRIDESMLRGLSAKAEQMRFSLDDIQAGEGDALARAQLEDLSASISRVCAQSWTSGDSEVREQCRRGLSDLEEARRELER